MTINERLKEIRKQLELTQADFGKSIGIAQGYLTNLESSRREVSNKIIKLVCGVYNVNEKWLITGEGEMFVKSNSEFSFDKFAKENELTSLETSIVKAYMSIDPKIRKDLINSFIKFISNENEVSATQKTNTNLVDVTYFPPDLKDGILKVAEDIYNNSDTTSIKQTAING